MKNSVLLIFTYCCFFAGFSQNKEPFPSFIGQNLQLIQVNQAWSVIEIAQGDLNEDGLADAALVLESNKPILEKRCSECKETATNARIILILINTKGELTTTIQNNKFVARSNEGGTYNHLQPDLTIKDGLLSIYYQFTRASMKYIFNFENKAMVIFKAFSNSVNGGTGDFVSEFYDFENLQLHVKTGNIELDADNIKSFDIKVPKKNLIDFEEMFSWEVVKDRFL